MGIEAVSVAVIGLMAAQTGLLAGILLKIGGLLKTVDHLDDRITKLERRGLLS